MLATCFIICIFCVNGQCQNLLISRSYHETEQINDCVIGILKKYFSEIKDLTYVSMTSNDYDVLKTVHSSFQFTMISRDGSQRKMNTNYGYLVHSSDEDTFAEHFEDLIREPFWNPNARFLIVFKSLNSLNLTKVFDALLRQHVNNVLVVSGLDNVFLYSYNPIDNFACGRYYDKIINYGLCSINKDDLYPDKLVYGLQKCVFRGILLHRPPFSIDPVKNEYKNRLTGMEQYVLNTVSELYGFKVSFDFSYIDWKLNTVVPNMTAIGPLRMLQTNETDVVFGSMALLAPRAAAFAPVCGYHDYVDEIRFAVKKAPLVPLWKYIYLEFNVFVWVLVLVSFVLYFAMMVYGLKSQDKGAVMLSLLGSLLLHGRDVGGSMRIKCFFLIWVSFALFFNMFYQSSLVSLTMNPTTEYQVFNEQELTKLNLRPCISSTVISYIQANAEEYERYNKIKIKDPKCENLTNAMKLVRSNNKIYTLIPSYFYLYNKKDFYNKWEHSLVYYFDKPYAKFILCYYFYKGFPTTHKFFINMLRMRENGLAEKNLRDQYYSRNIKIRYPKQHMGRRFVLPWPIYAVGILLAIISFAAELVIFYLRQYHLLKQQI